VIWKIMQEGQFHVCMSRELYIYNIFPLMYEVRRETDGRNTLQHLHQHTKSSEPGTRVREVPSAKQQLYL
jgi:hypothetical protein